MKRTQLGVLLPLAFAAAALIAVAAGCKDSNTITGNNAEPPTLTPTPPPAGSVAGTWTGTYVPADFVDCNSGPAQATFEQLGSTVTGTLSSSSDCGFKTVSFVGALQGNSLSGTISGGSRFADPSTAWGLLSGNTLDLTLENTVQAYNGGAMRLQR